MKENGHKKIEVGMTIAYFSSWGQGSRRETSVVEIELCENEGDKYGVEVNEVWIKDIQRAVFTLSDGHWCYGWQIDEVLG